MRCFMRPVDPRAGLQAAVVTKHSTDLATILADAAAMSATSPANIRIVLEAAADADATSADTPQSHLLQRAQAAGMPQAGIAGRPLVADWMDPVNAYLARIYAPHIAFARSYYDSVRSGAAFGVLAKISDAVFVERRPVDFAFRMADKAVSLAAAVRERMARGSGGEGGDDGGTEKS
ncbi:hypothetical protein HDU82_006995 [Entophlyctis luteolus]|nr:hypothetical protein HDU82_006995 [Entophlyctis luteolus]